MMTKDLNTQPPEGTLTAEHIDWDRVAALLDEADTINRDDAGVPWEVVYREMRRKGHGSEDKER